MCQYLAGVRLYLGLLNTTIPNYAMMAAGDFAEADGSTGRHGFVGRLDGLNDGLWCQSAMNVSDIGSWQLPNGSVVSDDPSTNPFTAPVIMAKKPGQVGLLRRDGLNNSPYQGMYTCTIPDENGINQILVVWTDRSTVYDGKVKNVSLIIVYMTLVVTVVHQNVTVQLYIIYCCC